MNLASTLLNRREELQMKKIDVTRAVGDVTHQAVMNWEMGISIPTDAHLIQLSQILQLDLMMLQQMKAEALADLDLRRSKNSRGFNKSVTPDTVRTSDAKDREPENAWSSIAKGIKNLFR